VISSSAGAADVVDLKACVGRVGSTETVPATVPTSRKEVAAALPSTTAAAAVAPAASTKAAIAAAHVGGGFSTAAVINKAAKDYGAFGVSGLTKAPAKGREMYPDRLSCAPFPNADTQKLVFGFVGEKQWLIMGAVCRQWQYMYKQYVIARYMEPNWQPQKWQRSDVMAYDEYFDTAYSAVFASLSTLQMGISSRTLDLHATRAQHNAGRYCSESVLLAAHKRGMPWSPAMLKGVGVSGSVSKIQWLLAQHKWKLPADIADCAAASGSVEMLRLLQQHKVVFTAETSLRAVKLGRLYLLKYLHKQGCPTHWKTVAAAASCGALGIIKLLHSTQSNFSYDLAFCRASGAGHLNIVVWLAEQGGQPSSSALLHAAIYGQQEVCKYLMERGCEWTADIIDGTITCSPELIPWALSQGVTLTAEQQIKLDKFTKEREYDSAAY
jgi:hypothetical protein